MIHRVIFNIIYIVSLMIHVYFTIMLFFLYKKYISQSTKKKKLVKNDIVKND